MFIDFVRKVKFTCNSICKKKIISFSILLVFLMVFVAGFAYLYKKINVTTRADASQYITYAYNLAKENKFSMSTEDTDVKLSAYREPAYPFLLSLAFRVTNITEIPRKQIFYKDIESGQIAIKREISSIFKPYANLGIVIYLLTGLIMFLIARKITDSTSLAVAAPLLLVFLMPKIYVLTLCNESLAFMLVALLTYTLVILAFNKAKTSVFAISGLVLGVLVLTKAHFMFLWFLLAVYFVFFLLRGFEFRDIIKKVSIFIIAYWILVFPWMYRNYTHFNSFYITNRGGIVLNTRVEYNKMNLKEYILSFGYFSQIDFINNALLKTKYFKNDDIERLNRNNPNGFYETSKKYRKNMGKHIRSDKVSCDRQLTRESINWIISHPLKHLAVSIPLGILGISYSNNLFSLILGYICFIAFMIASIRGFKNKDYILLSLVSVSLYNYMFMTFITHNIPRYNIVIIPMMIVCLVILFDYKITKQESLQVEKK